MTKAGDAADTPAVCAQIRQTRKRLKDQWQAENEGARGNPYTLEAVAARVPMTAKAYGAIERGQSEPNLARLRTIAAALHLDDDYFLPSGNLATMTARLEAEADRIAEVRGEVEDLAAALRGLLGQLGGSQSPPERG
jgi:transcriptional regulator with XRE-family HTH domain